MTFTTAGNNLDDLIALLRDKWDTSNVAKPNIRYTADPDRPARPDLREGDVILLMDVDRVKEPTAFDYNGRRVRERYQVDVRTRHSRSRKNSLISEVERILNSYRKAPTDDGSTRLGWDWIDVISERPLDNKAIKLYRSVIDVVLVNAYESIST